MAVKVAVISGAWPPVRCGVGDYTALLADALVAAGADVIRCGTPPRRWDTLLARDIAVRIADTGANIVHIQYPSTGFGRSLAPASLPLLIRRQAVVVTLHEFSIFRPYRWPWFAPYAYAAHACVFTSEAERRIFKQRMPGMRARSTVIPIGSNIPQGHAARRDPASICYFGLLMPGKGIEDFFECAALLGTHDDWRLSLIGAVAEGCEPYAHQVQARAQALGIKTHIGLPAHSVADLLQQMTHAYLPGPGGITERRGAVLAALQNGVRVLGPIGSAAPVWLRARVMDTATPAAAAQALVAHRHQPADAEILQPESETSWNAIAARHMALYRSLLQEKTVS